MTEKQEKELKDELGYLRREITTLKNNLRQEQDFCDKLKSVNTQLRDQIMRVSFSCAEPELISFTVNIQQFFRMHTKEREDYIRRVLIDTMQRLLTEVAHHSFLNKLRNEIK
jgi:hypothetical protein